jgi:glyoxylase-like metal-dependent hydrolase (beta-lactamase superfamily II)
VGNVGLFPKAQLLVQKEEYAAAFGPEPSKYGFDPTSYASLKSNPVKTLEGDYDVFGDGTVVIKRMVGHTPGHQALFLKLPKTGNILLSGDLTHYTDNWEHKRVPSFNFNKEQSIKSLEDTEKFLKDNNAVLWIQHDLEQNAGIKHVPAYYE